MKKNKQKLELTWIGKEKRPKLEPRILVEDKALSHCVEAASQPIDDLFADQEGEQVKPFDDNILIHGDNLLALKALENKYAGKVKCVFIDPPYNTGSAFTHYDDGVEHSMWLTLMRDRLEIIKKLLADDGSLWITIDDNECHYLKVLCDEVFGRQNFIANIVWQKKYAVANDHKTIAPMHDHLLVFQKSGGWQRNLTPRTLEKDRQYKHEDEKGVFRSSDYTCSKSVEERPNLYYSIKQPNTGENVWPSKTRVWAYSEKEHLRHVTEGFIYWGKNGQGKKPSFKRYKHLLKKQGIVPQTLWSHEYAGHTDSARKEIRVIFESTSLKNDFITPKPEKLVQRVIEIASNPGDLILDSFAGSGTTGAVAHKMGRRWIMVELGDHCETHIVPRLKKVIDNEDEGGISKAVNWNGGGGFRYYRLAASLLKKDTWGNWVINPEYNAEMLSEAMCKHMSYQYAPNAEIFWQHGHSTENNYIYVTTGTLSHDQLVLISSEVGAERSLLICCRGFQAGESSTFDNLMLKKIPQSVLHKCEWDQNDYSFNINVLPEIDEGAEE